MDTSTVLAIGLIFGVPMLIAVFIANEARRARARLLSRVPLRRRRARSKKRSFSDS